MACHGGRRKAGHTDAWENLYRKRDAESSGKQVVDPKDTLRRMYDSIIAPRLASRGADPANPVEPPKHHTVKLSKEAKRNGHKDKKQKKEKDKKSKKVKRKAKVKMSKRKKKKHKHKKRSSSSGSVSSSAGSSESSTSDSLDADGDIPGTRPQMSVAGRDSEKSPIVLSSASDSSEVSA
eukprot:CAMPEP_0194537416 /NCGR_PEP_ID=MMETSP0253-20130528/76675_1 /TAXON_ID=2966 /ORGANISM="Noctiluca scintillans" /LENGTH=178 /DNA_ID=CAMNT_0039383435 /DNA_START=18 /DNA_END=554 /DNA_ORIENTATION=-